MGDIIVMKMEDKTSFILFNYFRKFLNEKLF